MMSTCQERLQGEAQVSSETGGALVSALLILLLISVFATAGILAVTGGDGSLAGVRPGHTGALRCRSGILRAISRATLRVTPSP